MTRLGGGRIRTLSSVVAGLAQAGDIKTLQLRNALELHSTRALFRAALALLVSLISGRPLPLQCALFAVPSEHRRILEVLRTYGPNVIYLDMIRLAPMIPQLRKNFPLARIIFDMDDLVSRRFELIQEQRAAISLGYMAAKFPRRLARVMRLKFLSRILVAYESWALRHLEVQAALLADCTVLVSSHEAAMLLDRAPKAAVLVIPPPAKLVRSAPVEVMPPLRFVFVGSDKLLQNALTIDWLLATWRRLKPDANLLIVGRQTRHHDAIVNVEWLGFVEDLSDVYKSSSVLLAPAFIGGGVKTKILEAFGFGCPVAGNATSFEGLEIAQYPLALDDAALDALVSHPAAHLPLLRDAAIRGWRFIADVASESRHQAAWAALADTGTHAI